MRGNARTFLSNEASRRALMSVGAYIAGACLGQVAPGGIEAIHEAFQHAVVMNPFVDPISQVSALYEGAQYQSAAAIHTVGEWCQSVGVEISQKLREEIDRARGLLGPNLDQAKSLFLETWRPASEAAVALRDHIRNAIPSTEAALFWSKEVGKAAVDVIRNAVEAYGIYEAGKKIYQRIFSRARREVRESLVPAENEARSVTEQSINLNLNTAVGGGAVADAALRNREIRIGNSIDPTTGLSAIGKDRIIWVSDRLGRRLSSDLNDLLADTESGRGEIVIRPPGPDRVEGPADPVEDLRHRARFPLINWDESALSAARLSQVRQGLRGEADLRGPDEIRNIKLILADDGTVQAKREQPAASSPDFVM